MWEGAVGLGIACLLAAAIAEYAKLRRRSERGFNWIAVAGIFFIFAGTFPVSGLSTYIGGELTGNLSGFFGLLGWIFALVGTLYVAYEILLR